MIGDRKHLVRFQSDFYRDSYRKILRGLMITMIVMFLCIIGIIYYILFQPPTKYYATTTTGRIISMIPVAEK